MRRPLLRFDAHDRYCAVSNPCHSCHADLRILRAAVLGLRALSCSVLGALWLRGGFSSATGLDERPVLSLQLDVCGQADGHLLRGGGEGGTQGGGWAVNPGATEGEEGKTEYLGYARSGDKNTDGLLPAKVRLCL